MFLLFSVLMGQLWIKGSILFDQHLEPCQSQAVMNYIDKMRAVMFNFLIMSLFIPKMQGEDAGSLLDYRGQSSLEPGTSPITSYEVRVEEAGGTVRRALKASQPTKELQIIKSRPPISIAWSQKNLSPSLDPSLYRPRTKPNIKTPATKSRKMFGWGDFYLSIGTAKFSLLLTGKLLDHVNGTFSLYFRHNSTRLGNLSVNIVAPSRPLKWEVPKPRQKSWNPIEDSELQLHSSSSSGTEYQQQQQQEKMVAESLNCWLEDQRTSQAKRARPCLYDPAQTCYSEHSQSHSTWVCAKPCKVLCILVSFISLDYKLLHKVCPDYNYQDQHQYFG